MTARSGGRRLPEIRRLWGATSRSCGRWLAPVLEGEMTAALGGHQGQADGRAARLPLAREPFTAPIGFLPSLKPRAGETHSALCVATYGRTLIASCAQGDKAESQGDTTHRAP
jgi:hypothetical protein